MIFQYATLNATEQQIEEVLDGMVLLASEKAFNFGFYTKVSVGDTTVNLKIISRLETILKSV